jgi:molybdopterin synthase sulfur carrier subunit
MPVVWIPALLRDLTGGQAQVRVAGATVRQAVDALETQYPGVKARLLEGERLRPGISVVVDGLVSAQKLRHRLEEHSEVHFLPAIGGGDGVFV